MDCGTRKRRDAAFEPARMPAGFGGKWNKERDMFVVIRMFVAITRNVEALTQTVRNCKKNGGRSTVRRNCHG